MAVDPNLPTKQLTALEQLKFTVNDDGLAFGLGTTGALSFNTNMASTPVTQFQINHTASANRYVTVTGSNGGNPTVNSSAGALQLQSAGQNVLRVDGTASTVNYFAVISNSTGNQPWIEVQGETNVPFGLYSRGTGSLNFHTGGGRDGALQVQVLDTASASRTLTLTGSNGGNPTISTSSGDVAFGKAIHLTSGATVSTASGGFRIDNQSGVGARLDMNSASDPLLLQTQSLSRLAIKPNGQVRFVPLAADPAGAENGDVYYNSTTNKLRVYAGGAWADLH